MTQRTATTVRGTIGLSIAAAYLPSVVCVVAVMGPSWMIFVAPAAVLIACWFLGGFVGMVGLAISICIAGLAIEKVHQLGHSRWFAPLVVLLLFSAYSIVAYTQIEYLASSLGHS